MSLGAAWLGLVVSELMGASEGIGYLIMDARQFTRTEVVFLSVLSSSLLAGNWLIHLSGYWSLDY
ncbi:hypothetical protein GCM10020331_076220 [Ectobacillus funiculus]